MPVRALKAFKGNSRAFETPFKGLLKAFHRPSKGLINLLKFLKAFQRFFCFVLQDVLWKGSTGHSAQPRLVPREGGLLGKAWGEMRGELPLERITKNINVH